MDDLAAWATVVGGFATALAAAFAAWQLLLLHRDREAAARAAIDGVAVTWHPVIRPRQADANGQGDYVYDIEVHNPGSLPIRDVEIRLTFPVEVCRVHGDERVEEPRRTLDLGTAVLVGGTSRSWRRTLRIPFEVSMRGIEATVSFVDMRGVERTNRWAPRESPRRSS